jgi:hypothetical protein
MWLAFRLGLACTALACSATSESPGVQGPGGAGASGTAGTAGSAGTPAAGGGASGQPAAAGNSGQAGGAGTPTATAGTTAPSAGSGGTAPPPEVMEMLDPDVDWTALPLIFPAMYSAYDGVHTFQVPVRVDGVTVELSDWQAIPASAVSFDPDPDGGGVLISVHEPVPEVTIAVSSGMLGGTAPLYITEATPEDWNIGEARYNNGVDYELPTLSFVDLINPNWTPPEPPDNLACNNCHTTGAKYFEIQHTPTQIAYVSDEDLLTILTTGTKPEGVEWSVLPPDFQHLYVGFHTWQAVEQEQLGLIVYLRSLTPTGQADILIPGQIGP